MTLNPVPRRFILRKRCISERGPRESSSASAASWPGRDAATPGDVWRLECSVVEAIVVPLKVILWWSLGGGERAAVWPPKRGVIAQQRCCAPLLKAILE